MITQERLKSVMRYVPETGEFFWLVSSKVRRAGERAGCLHKRRGYCYVTIDGRQYAMHALAWLYVHGVYPSEMDHCNHDRADNRIENLRPATRAQNGANKGPQKNNTSGYKGVTWDRCLGKWKAQLGRKSLGYFHDPQEAHEAYKSAAKQKFGEFARFDL